jgi:hypothetical protein
VRALLIVAVALAGCGKTSSSPKTKDDAAIAAPAPSTTPAPALPPTNEPAPPADAALATHVTPTPSTAFGHFCVNLNGRSKCVTSEDECKKLAPRCGQWKSVFCFKTPTGPSCFTSSEDCKASLIESSKAGVQVTSDCVQDEM